MTFLNDVLATGLKFLYVPSRADLEERARAALDMLEGARRERDVLVRQERDAGGRIADFVRQLVGMQAERDKAREDCAEAEIQHAALTGHAWTRVLSWVRKDRPALASVLEHGRLVRFDAEVVEIALGSAGARRWEDGEEACLRDALYAFFRVRPELRVVADGQPNPLREKVARLKHKVDHPYEPEARRILTAMWARMVNGTGPWALIIPEAEREQMAAAIEWVDVIVAERDRLVGRPVQKGDLNDKPEAVPPEAGQVWRLDAPLHEAMSRTDIRFLRVVRSVGPAHVNWSDGTDSILPLATKHTLIGYQLPDGRRVMVGDRFRLPAQDVTVLGVCSGGCVNVESLCHTYRRTVTAVVILNYPRL